MIPGQVPSGWDVMRELLLQTERSKRKGEEAPSGCNYLPYLNNAFVMIIIERSLTASTWDLTRPSEKSKLQAGGGTGKAACQARPALRAGSPTAPAGTGTAGCRRPGPLRGSGDTFPDVAFPLPHAKGRATPRRPHARRRGEEPAGGSRAGLCPHGQGRAAAGPIPPPGSAGGAYGLMPRRGDGSSNKPTGTAAELYRVAQGGPVQGGAGDLGLARGQARGGGIFVPLRPPLLSPLLPPSPPPKGWSIRHPASLCLCGNRCKLHIFNKTAAPGLCLFMLPTCPPARGGCPSPGPQRRQAPGSGHRRGCFCRAARSALGGFQGGWEAASRPAQYPPPPPPKESQFAASNEPFPAVRSQG